MEVEKFVFKQLELLEWEREAEMAETRTLQEGVPSKELERRGICLRKLRIGAKRSGLYGRTLVKMEPQWNGKPMPAHNLSSGDIVGVTSVGDFGHQDSITSGVVWATSSQTITVAFDLSLDTLPLNDQTLYGLIKLANDVTYRRIRWALEKLRKYGTGCASRLIEVLFGLAPPSDPLASLPKEILGQLGELKFFNSTLDASQRSAVDFALRHRELAIVHGPPGTGKTTTVIEIIRQCVAQGLKILACAPSNVAVDNLTERLSNCGTKIVRLGHPARSLLADRDVSLDALVSSSDNAILVDDIRSEVDAIRLKIHKSNNDGEKRRLRGEVKALSHELRTREAASLKEILQKADVILATLSSSHGDGPIRNLGCEHFDLIVIDECSQGLEAACWIPLLRAPKCVLAGDHLQLPPTIVSEKAAKDGFEVTLMERLLKTPPLGETSVRMLTTQYRMNEAIMEWPSRQLYGSRLVADSSVKGHLLCDLPGVMDDENTSVPLVLIDTAGCDLTEMDVGDDYQCSRGNEGEAKLVAIYVESLMASGIDPKNVAVIAPYNLQVELLRLLLSQKYPALEIKSVDGFQGREKEAVILSLVRSNISGDVGFLSEDRRLNVAITRARRHLAVVCDGATVSKHPFLAKFVEYLYSVADVRSAHQYQNELDSNRFEAPASLIRSKTTASNKSTKAVVTDRSTSKVSKVAKKSTLDDKRMISGLRKEGNSYEIVASSKQNKTAEGDEQCRRNIEESLKVFMENAKSTNQVFPPALNSFERRLVHEIAEKFGLTHVSSGDGDQRFITVQKSAQVKSVSARNKRDIGSSSATNERESVSANKRETGATSSATKLKGATVSETKPKVETVSAAKLKVESVSAKKCHTGATASVNKREDSAVKVTEKSSQLVRDGHKDDDDLILDRAVRASKKCGIHGCKVGISILMQVCSLCKVGFCLGHHIPEAHGCGEAARTLARQRIRREGAIVPGSGEINRRLDPQKRAQLERKFEKKLAVLGDQRNRKKRNDDEKK